MTTLYVDVYFLINFTVNILSMFLSSKFLHIRTTVIRLIIGGIVSSALAIIYILMPSSFFFRIAGFIVFVLFEGGIISKNVSIIRRIKFISLLVVCECLIGGMVHYGYVLLDEYFYDMLSDIEGNAENRKALLFSLIILLIIGAFKILIMLFSGEKNIKRAEIKIEIEGFTAETEALIDSGNLVCDPLNMCPVVFIKKKFAKKILPQNIIELSHIDDLKSGYRKRIRLIPITRNGSTHVLTGVKADKVFIKIGQQEEEINVTVAIDKEEGDFGGYEALVPSSALDDVI